MLQTLLVNLKLHFREKSQLFWLFAFPIILATMFNGMFGNIAESYELRTIDVVVVDNDDWRASPGAQTLVDGISSDAEAHHGHENQLSAGRESAAFRWEGARRAISRWRRETAVGHFAGHTIVRHGCDGIKRQFGHFPDGIGQYRGLVQSQHQRGDQYRAA